MRRTPTVLEHECSLSDIQRLSAKNSFGFKVYFNGDMIRLYLHEAEDSQTFGNKVQDSSVCVRLRSIDRPRNTNAFIRLVPLENFLVLSLL